MAACPHYRPSLRGDDFPVVVNRGLSPFDVALRQSCPLIRSRRANRLPSKSGPSAAEERTVCRQKAGRLLPKSEPSAVEQRAVRCRRAYRLPSKSGPSAAEERTVCRQKAGRPLPKSVPSAVKKRLKTLKV